MKAPWLGKILFLLLFFCAFLCLFSCKPAQGRAGPVIFIGSYRGESFAGGGAFITEKAFVAEKALAEESLPRGAFARQPARIAFAEEAAEEEVVGDSPVFALGEYSEEDAHAESSDEDIAAAIFDAMAMEEYSRFSEDEIFLAEVTKKAEKTAFLQEGMAAEKPEIAALEESEEMPGAEMEDAGRRPARVSRRAGISAARRMMPAGRARQRSREEAAEEMEAAEEAKIAPIEEITLLEAAGQEEVLAVHFAEEAGEAEKENIGAVIEDLNKITKEKDYSRWLEYLAADYRETLSSADYLDRISKRLPQSLKNRRIRLSSIEDYFTYVFVPARQNAQAGDILFISPTTAYVIAELSGKKRAAIYILEKGEDGSWMLSNKS